MHVHQEAELLALLPDRMEFRIGELLAIDMGADRHAAQPELLDAVFELLDRQIRVLHGDSREGHEAIRVRGDDFGELLVLDPDQLFGDVAARRHTRTD